MTSDKKKVYIYGWHRSLSTYISSTDTVEDIHYKFKNAVGIPYGSYLWINRPSIIKENNIKLEPDNKLLFKCGLVDEDVITVVSPITIMINGINIDYIYMDVKDKVSDLRDDLLLLGIIDDYYNFMLRFKHKKFYSKKDILCNMFNDLDLKVHIVYY